MIRASSKKGAFDSSIDRANQGLDYWLLISSLLLLLLGLASIHSIDFSRTGSSFMVKQMLFAAIGLVVLLLCASVSTRTLIKVAPWLYSASVLSLVAIFFTGKKTKGSTRWIDFGPMQFQPSEVAKVVLIITLSAYFAKRWNETKDFKTYIGSLVHAGPIILLVLLQPHFAGAMSLAIIWLAISLYAAVPWKYILTTVALIGTLIAVAWYTPIMPDYMRSRILAKANPDPKANGYQQDRAKIAFGVGGLSGVGYLRGEQKAGRYIPEQQNDFIFTVIGEELGLIGATLTLGMYGFFFFRIWLAGYRAREPMSQMMSSGVLAVLGFHTIVNLGMNVGILPVAGLWLPLISYGGTALWMCMACIGLLANSK